MSEENWLYKGNLISQAKAETLYFDSKLEKVLDLKNKGQLFVEEYHTSMDIITPPLNFNSFQKYTDDRLSSANPKIYIIDLDEILVTVDKCITNYCRLIEKQIGETEKIFLSAPYFLAPEIDRTVFIFAPQAFFCFNFKNYYKKKRQIIIGEDNNWERPEADYIIDKTKVRELLGRGFDSANDRDVNIFIANILFFKWGPPQPPQIPNIHINSISQTKLIAIASSIKKEFKWNDKARRFLSNIFGQLIESYDSEYKPIRFNTNTMYRGM